MAVHEYDGTGKAGSPSRGSKHADLIGTGIELTRKISGKDAPLAKPKGSGVDAGGTKNMGAKQKSHQGGLASQPGANDSAPDGLSAPHGNKF
jgi:hypothetical protein